MTSSVPSLADLPGWLWIFFTIAAALLQTARNATQRSLTGPIGTVGATHVRFLFGLPFGLLFLAIMASVVGLQGLHFTPGFYIWTAVGAVSQIVATALMLATMRERSFVVTTAFIKTEPVQIALFGLIFLGDRLSAVQLAAVVLATAGVLLMSRPATPLPEGSASQWRAAGMGIASGALFALSAVGFRGGILALGDDAAFYVRATTTLASGLMLQTLLLSVWLAWRDRQTLRNIMRLWRPSLLAGAAGAAASQMWFLAFAIQSAAAVRTLALIEIIFAQIVSRRLFAQGTSRNEAVGMALMIAGVAWLLLTRP